MTGTSRLHESGGGTTQTVDLTVKVSIPLVGGKIEGFIADLLVKALEAEDRGRPRLPRRLIGPVDLARRRAPAAPAARAAAATRSRRPAAGTGRTPARG